MKNIGSDHRSLFNGNHFSSLLNLVIVKYGVISLVLCISTRLRLVTILFQLVNYLVILHADQCNWASEASPTLVCSVEISRNI